MKECLFSPLHNMVQDALEAGELSVALAGCEMELAKDPGSAEIWHTKGKIYFAMRDTTAAEACYDRALRLRPDFLTCRLDHARIARMLGQLQEAMWDLCYVLKADPCCREAQQQQALIRQEQKRAHGHDLYVARANPMQTMSPAL